MKLSINKRYMIIQGLFWMVFCISFGFISLYLLDAGVSNSSIGIVTAIFGAVSAILQPFLGNVCDRSRKVNWKNTILVCSGLYLVVCIIMVIATGRLAASILLGCLMVLGNLILPFMNSALFYYKNCDEYINFGVARGIGSFMYAVMALIVGNLAGRFGTRVLPIMGTIVILLFFLIILSMPYDINKDNFSVEKIKDERQDKRRNGFIRKYPSFIVLVVGFALLLTTHNVTGTYLLQIIQHHGGNSSDFGIASAIQATVEVPVLFGFSYLQKKISAEKLMKICAFGYVIKAMAFYLSNSVNSIYYVMITQMLSFAIFASASVYYTGEKIDEADRTTGQAIMSSVMVVGTLVGSLVGGFLLDSVGIPKMLFINIIISVVGLLVVGVSFIYDRK